MVCEWRSLLPIKTRAGASCMLSAVCLFLAFDHLLASISPFVYFSVDAGWGNTFPAENVCGPCDVRQAPLHDAQPMR